MIAILHFSEYMPNKGTYIFCIGFIFVDDLLRLWQFQRYSEDDVKKVVAENDKKRFALRNDPATGFKSEQIKDTLWRSVC